MSDLIRLMWCRIINHVLPTHLSEREFLQYFHWPVSISIIRRYATFKSLSGLKLACNHLTSPFTTSILFASAFHAIIIKYEIIIWQVVKHHYSPTFLQLRSCCATALRMHSVIIHRFRLFITLHLPQLFLQFNSVSNPSLKVLYGHENRLVTALNPSWHLTQFCTYIISYF